MVFPLLYYKITVFMSTMFLLCSSYAMEESRNMHRIKADSIDCFTVEECIEYIKENEERERSLLPDSGLENNLSDSEIMTCVQKVTRVFEELCPEIYHAFITGDSGTVKAITDLLDDDIELPELSASDKLRLASHIAQQCISLHKKRHSDNYIALRKAIAEENCESACSLVASMTDEEMAEQSESGDTALHQAVACRNLFLVTLLAKKMTLDQIVMQNDKGNTALHKVFDDGRLNRFEIAQLLLLAITTEHMGIQNKNGRTVLHRAAQYGGHEVVRLCLQKMTQSQIGIQDKHGGTALYDAICTYHPDAEVINLIANAMSMSQILAQNKIRDNALHAAIDYGNTVAVKLLIAKMQPEQVSEASRSRYTALHMAAVKGNYEIAKMVLEKTLRPVITAKQEFGNTAFYLAAYNDHRSIVELLMPYMTREQIFEKNKYGTVLHMMATRGCSRAMEYCVQKLPAEDLCWKNKYGHTPLHVAVIHDRTHIVNQLISNMNVEQILLPDTNGKNALALTENAEIIQLIESKLTTT